MEQASYEDCYKSAFGITIVEIEGANDVSVTEIYAALTNNKGNNRKQGQALVECLGSSGWYWKSYGESVNSEKEALKMAESVALSVELLAHALHRREQMAVTAHRRPIWRFRAGGNSQTPDSCHALDGVTKHYQDPFWKTHTPPCGRPYCACQVQSLSERDLARDGRVTKK